VQSKANRNAKYLSIRFPEKERKKKSTVVYLAFDLHAVLHKEEEEWKY